MAASTQPNNKKLVTTVSIVVGALLALAVLGGIAAFILARNVGDKVGESIEQSSALVKEISQYPDAYVEAGLPQYPGAEVTHLGKKDAKLADGSIVFYISTNDEVAAVAAFYDKELKATSWKLKPESSTEATELISRSYTKQGQEYGLLVQRSTDSNNSTTATITWQQVQ